MTFSHRDISSSACSALGSLLLCGVSAFAQALPPSQPSQTGMNSPTSSTTNNMNTPKTGMNAVPTAVPDQSLRIVSS